MLQADFVGKRYGVKYKKVTFLRLAGAGVPSFNGEQAVVEQCAIAGQSRAQANADIFCLYTLALPRIVALPFKMTRTRLISVSSKFVQLLASGLLNASS